MGTARAVCARLRTPCAHNAHDLTWCSALFCALFRSPFGSLFMDTVHEHCSQGKKKEYKILKNFLGGDLIYEIFILHLL